MKVNVAGYVRLLSSSPHHIVYRRPPEPLGKPEDDELVIGPETQNTDDFDPGDFEVGDDEDLGADEAEPVELSELPEESSEPPIVIDPEPNELLDYPTIQFSVSVKGYPYWKAQIVIYPVGQVIPIATYTTPTYPAEQTSALVSWDEIFRDQKPPTGVYTYDIIVDGVFAPSSPTSLNPSETDRDRRLSEKAHIQNLQVTPQFNPVTASVLFLIRFQVIGAEKVLSARAEIRNFRGEEIGSVELQSQNGWWQGQYLLKIDSAGKLGNLQVIACADVREGGKNRVVRQAIDSLLITLKVTGVALGFEVYDGQNRPVLSDQDRRRPYAGYTAIFRAFVRLNWRVGDNNFQQWYSDVVLSLQDLTNRYSWITPPALTNEFAGRPQSDVLQLPDHLRQLLDLQVIWQKFRNRVVDHEAHNPNGRERWYGMEIDLGETRNGMSFQWIIPRGTHWWGASVRWYHQQNGTNGNTRIARHRMVFLYPTNRVNGVHLIRQVNDQTEYHGNVERSGDARFNWAQVGPNGRRRIRLWHPNPWQGRISAKLRQPVVTFTGQDTPENREDDDPFFANEPNPMAAMQRQGEFNRQAVELAYSFENVPYSWGGTSYGGKQSSDPSQYTCSNRWHDVRDQGRRFGIDCSGLVWKVADELGMGQVAQRLGVRWVRMNSTQLAQTPTARDMPFDNQRQTFIWQYVRPGDFACHLRNDGSFFPIYRRRCNHVVYVSRTPENFNDRGVPIVLETVEAAGENHRVLARERRQPELERYIPRRWIAP